MPTESDPVELVERLLLEGMDETDEEVIREVCADEIQLMGRSGSIPAEYILTNTNHLYEAMPDLDHEILDIWEDDGTVTVHYKNSGTFENELQIEGDPMVGDLQQEPNGEEIEYHGVYLVGVEDGEITSWMNYSEQLNSFQQLGLIPEMDELLS